MNEIEGSNAVNEDLNNSVSVTAIVDSEANEANTDNDVNELAALLQIKKSHDVELGQQPLQSMKNQLAILVNERDTALRTLAKEKWCVCDRKCSTYIYLILKIGLTSISCFKLVSEHRQTIENILATTKRAASTTSFSRLLKGGEGDSGGEVIILSVRSRGEGVSW